MKRTGERIGDTGQRAGGRWPERAKPAGRRYLLLGGLSLTLLLQGCSPVLLEREYVTEQPHVENSYLNDSSVLRADSYDTLVDGLLQLVSGGTEHGVIRLFHYSGDVSEDLAQACLEVKRNTPLGAYAVDYMTHEVSRIVSYYEVNVYITYRRSYEKIKTIVTATGSNAVKQVLADTLARFAPSAVLSVRGVEEEAFDLQMVLQEVYDTLPGAAFGLPEYTIAWYPSAPEETEERILEIQLTYGEPQEQLLRKQARVEERASLLAGQEAGAFGRELLTRLYQVLLKQTSYEAAGGSTVYDGLMEGRADSEGMAMAMALLCRKAGLPCEVIRGRRNGMPWVWNRVTLGEEVVELDVSAGSLLRKETPECVPAGQMGGIYAYGSAENA